MNFRSSSYWLSLGLALSALPSLAGSPGASSRRKVHRSWIAPPPAAPRPSFAAAVVAPPPTAPQVPDTLGPGRRLHFDVPHTFSRSDAHARVQQMLDYWNSRWGVQAQWFGETALVSGQVMGLDFKARLDVSDSDVRGQTTDPGGLWRSTARNYIFKKLRKYLHPQYQDD